MGVDWQRRRFIATAAAAGALMPFASRAMPATRPPVKAIAFDAFPIFDPRAIFRAVKQRFPQQGEALGAQWFARLFPYTWFRTTAGQYARFDVVAEEALEAAAEGLGLALKAADRDALVAAFYQMPVWPDVVEQLTAFQKRGLRMAILSNLSEPMLRANMHRTDIDHFFQAALSTDRVRAFKPSPRAYQLGVEAFNLQKEEIAFVAFASWDAIGASWFGYPTVWVNRLGQKPEGFGAASNMIVGRDLGAIGALL